MHSKKITAFLQHREYLKINQHMHPQHSDVISSGQTFIQEPKWLSLLSVLTDIALRKST